MISVLPSEAEGCTTRLILPVSSETAGEQSGMRRWVYATRKGRGFFEKGK